MEKLQCLLYKNNCYNVNNVITPTRIVVHSTGANNPFLKRYVQPHVGQNSGLGGKTYKDMSTLLGKNRYSNDWNRSGISACVHAFIGKLDNGKSAIVQTLPWNMKCWGVGKGKYGSFNNCAIQFEICEDALNSKEYFLETYNLAVELCAKLCSDYHISVKNIASHRESYYLGYASNHGDPEHWWKKFGVTMDDFRKAVDKKINSSSTLFNIYKVKVIAKCLNIRAGAGTKFNIVGCVSANDVYTIVEKSGDWGKLKSGAGWIHLGYTEKV